MVENKGAEDSNSEWKYGVKWDEKLETGHEKIDEQHKELFRLTSDLIEACEREYDLNAVGETLNFLVSYTAGHFSDEETLMTESDYRGYEHHKKKHEDFKQVVTELIERYHKSGSTSELSREVNSIVVRWLITHISMADRKFADFIKSGGSPRN